MCKEPVRVKSVFGILLFFLQTCLFFSCKKTDRLPGGDDWHWNGTVVAADPKAVPKTNSQKLYVHYMPWFETPESQPEKGWGLHWTMANQNPDIVLSNGRRQIASFYYPLIGPYASSDPDVIDYHTLLMKYTGIDGVIVDWYGSHELFDYPLNRRNTDSLFARLPLVGLKFSVCYEDITLKQVKQMQGLEPVAAAQQDFTYLQSNYFTSSSYIQINNQPLVFCFGPQVLQTESDWQQTLSYLPVKPRLLSLWDLGTRTGNQGSGEYAWIYEDNTDCQYFYQYKAPTMATAFGSAFPGLKDFYAQGGWGSPLLYGSTMARPPCKAR